MPVAANRSTGLNLDSGGALPNSCVMGFVSNAPSGTQTRFTFTIVPFLSCTLTLQETLSGAEYSQAAAVNVIFFFSFRKTGAPSRLRVNRALLRARMALAV